VLALEQTLGLHRRLIVLVETAGVDAVILRVGARLFDGQNWEATFAEKGDEWAADRQR
jgi:hypothetical protein